MKMTTQHLLGAAAALGLAVSATASTHAQTMAEAQVIATDLIVDGSICAGFDCVNAESFGADTLRLKENNLRIHFQDTSNSGSFPTRDWRIIVNDSSNGGANYFAIQDSDVGQIPFRILAGAGNNALYVDAQGDVGLNTSNPIVELHIADGDSPTLRLEQTGASGFTPQTWDVAGNETNFFVRDVTNGSELPFRIRPGADDNAIYIENNNNLGFGTNSPDQAMHLYRTSGDAIIHAELTAGVGSPGVHVEYSGSDISGRNMFTMTNNGAPQVIMNNLATNDVWEMGAGNAFFIDHDTSGTRVFRVTDSGDVIIPGDITTGGSTCGGGCDAVFDEGHDLPSIVDHAEQMWSLGYLPNVGPTVENEPINLSRKVGGMLNELETAHIYIAELNDRLAESDARYDALLERLEAIEAERLQP